MSDLTSSLSSECPNMMVYSEVSTFVPKSRNTTVKGRKTTVKGR